MNILVNYANERFKFVQKLNSLSGKYIAKFDKIYSFSPGDIEDSFRKKHGDILSYERGNGLWLWKPYFINRVISETKDGDYIFYLDSGAFFIRKPRMLYTYVNDENPIFVTDNPLIESCWTKSLCFELMNASEYKDSNQIQATYILVKVNDYTRSFFKTYLDLCCNKDLILPEGLGKYDKIEKNYGKQFVSHREDQSILSLLCKKNAIKPHRDISQRGFWPNSFYSPHYAYRVPEHPDDKYKSIVFLHKSSSLGIVFWLRYIKNRYISKWLSCK